MEAAFAEATSQKNRAMHRGGVLPSQLVFGVNPRIAADLMSDHASKELGGRELVETSGDHDAAAAEFRREAWIRIAVREALSSREATSKLRTAAAKRAHQDRTYTQGQWVYVWR